MLCGCAATAAAGGATVRAAVGAGGGASSAAGDASGAEDGAEEGAEEGAEGGAVDGTDGGAIAGAIARGSGAAAGALLAGRAVLPLRLLLAFLATDWLDFLADVFLEALVGVLFVLLAIDAGVGCAAEIAAGEAATGVALALSGSAVGAWGIGAPAKSLCWSSNRW
jgi:hypothetical protein